jgi:hypothetical protein
LSYDGPMLRAFLVLLGSIAVYLVAHFAYGI